MSFADLVAELQAAVEEELVEVRASDAARRIPLHGGRGLGRAGTDWLYAFALQYPVTLPDDVPVRIEFPSGEAFTGQLLASSSFEVTLACGARLPDKLTGAMLTLDTSFILEQLLARLSELQEEDCDLPLALFGLREPRAGQPVADLDDPKANEFQLDALRAVLERDVTYVWGPPGTGKTTALALIAEALVRRGLRVLAVASTNVAVDNAVLKTAERLRQAGQVVRFGTPQLPALREPGPAPAGARGSLLQTMPLPFEEHVIPSVARNLGVSPSTALHQDSSWPKAPRNDIGITVLPAKRLPEPRDEAARLRTLRQARVVGATLSRIALNPELSAPGFDAVLIDEASAAQLPAVFVAAAPARKKVVALGDPKQLPPVAVSNGPFSRRWLQRDVFAQAGLDDEDARAVLLREQYRMPPAISRLANQLVYAGRLIDALGARRKSGDARLVDTSSEGGHCERDGGSRLNRVHAEIAIELAAELAERWASSADAQASVAIITPYRAQARLLWRLLRDARLEKAVDVGTVHRFQGLERQAIVFDTVESEPHQPAPFVAGGYGSDAMRLLNVAITRAQSELVVIANASYLCRTLRRGATLLGLLELLKGNDGDIPSPATTREG